MTDIIPQRFLQSQLGWKSDEADDPLDYKINDLETKELGEKILTAGTSVQIPRENLPENGDQKNIGACVAWATCGIVEHTLKRKRGKNVSLSKLFTYYNARRLRGWQEKDTGSYLRDGMHVLRRIGVPEENYYPYDTTKFTQAPDSFAYNFADEFRSISNWRLDVDGIKSDELVALIEKMLTFGISIAFGMSVYQKAWSQSYTQRDSKSTGIVPFPGKDDKVMGGHAIRIVGIDYNEKITNQYTNETTEGTLTIANSWGDSWGDKSFGKISLEYARQNYLRDLWISRYSTSIDTKRYQ